MIDIVKYLQKYPDDPAAVMSKARVEEAIAEIERLRGESAVNRHIISCLREEIRLEREARQTDEEQIDKLTAERDELRALMGNVIDDDHYHMLAERTRARIEALLNKRGGDE